MQCSIAGFPITVADGNESFWLAVSSGLWEPDVLRLFAQKITKETTVVDIGAWIGPTTLYAAHLGRRVFAFEPDPVALSRLRENIALNPEAGNVTIVPAAVTPHGRAVRLRSTGELGNSLSSLVHGSDETLVASVCLADYLEERGVAGPLFIKMDVEGYEFELGAAMRSVLKRMRAVLLVSLHPQLIARRERTLVRRAINRLQFGIRVARLFWPLRRFVLTDEAARAISAAAVIRAAFLRGSLELGDRMLLAESGPRDAAREAPRT